MFDPTGRSGKPITGLDQFKSLLRELPRNATAAAVATLELEVAMIADFEFFSAEVDPAIALLNRLNVVDGIFSEQVGVAITAPSSRCSTIRPIRSRPRTPERCSTRLADIVR